MKLEIKFEDIMDVVVNSEPIDINDMVKKGYDPVKHSSYVMTVSTDGWDVSLPNQKKYIHVANPDFFKTSTTSNVNHLEAVIPGVLQVHFNVGFNIRDKKCIEDEFEIISKKITKKFKEVEEYYSQQLKDDLQQEWMFGIENGIREKAYDKINKLRLLDNDEDSKKLNFLIIGSSQAPNSFNFYDQLNKGGYDLPQFDNSIVLGNHGIDNTNEKNKEIHSDLTYLMEKAPDFFKNFDIETDWKFRYKIHLTKSGQDILHGVLKESSIEYYKENNLNPENHTSLPPKRRARKKI